MKTRFGVGIVVGAMFAAGTVHAERVQLKDGSVMEGDLVEKVQGDHVTLKLATGETRTVAWARIEAGEQAPQANTVHVVVTSSRERTSLNQLVGSASVAVVGRYGTSYGHVEQYKAICTAPCEADVEPGGDYKIAGEVTPSGVFNLPRGEHSFRLNVKAGSAGMRFGGLVSSIFGAGAVLVGGLLIPLAFAMPETDGAGNTAPSSGLLGVGIGTAVVGAVLLGLGIPLIIASGTHVESGNGEKISHGPKLSLRGFSF